eukprot:6176343-Pleurochrysis_carterae.AAC.5
MRVALQSPTASLESRDPPDLVKATSSEAITVDDAEREILRRMACADDALVLSKLTAMHGVIKVQAEEGRGVQTGRDLVSPTTGLTRGQQGTSAFMKGEARAAISMQFTQA